MTAPDLGDDGVGEPLEDWAEPGEIDLALVDLDAFPVDTCGVGDMEILRIGFECRRVAPEIAVVVVTPEFGV